MATYSTDLTSAALADSDATENWTEFGSADTGGSPADDDENYIQGVNCQSQTTGTKSGTTNPKSVVYQHGSDLATGWTSGDAFFVWQFYAVGTNLYDYDQTTYSGLEIGVSNDTTNVDRFFVGGADVRRNPYGGWDNVVVDPEQTADATYGTGGAGYTYIGSIAYTINAISKGTPHAVDAIRYGRGVISVTGTGGSFSELASYNDYNGGGTPPGTSSTTVDSGYHRLGLFQDSGGTYLWKGLLSFGVTATSVTFSDSNKTILIDDAAKTYAAFNKIEVHNASSSVTLTNITFTALGTVAPGDFEMIADATFNAYGCTFNEMGTFIFDSNCTVASVFNSTGLVTKAEADFAESSFLAPTVAADEGAVYVNETIATSTTVSTLDDTTFSKGANAHHALRFGTGVTADITLTGIEFTGWSASTNDANDSIFRFDATTGSINLNLVDCTVDGSPITTTTATIDDAAGITVTPVIDPKTTKFTVENQAGTVIENARVFTETADNGGGSGFPYKASVTTLTSTGGTATLTASAAHGLVTGDQVVVRGAQPDDYNKVATITVTSTTVFTYSVTSGITSPATATPVFSYVPVHGLTNTLGVIQSSKTWPASQGVKGWVRKSTTSPYYKQSNISIADASGGTDALIQMILDE